MGIQSTPATGTLGKIHIGQEDTWGKKVQPTHLFEFVSESIQATEEVLESAGIRGNRAKNDIGRGQLAVDGDISLELPPAGLGMLIYNALGDYIKLNRVDGGYHARLQKVDSDFIGAPDIAASGVSRYVLELAPETTLEFEDSQTVAFVYRDGGEELAFDNNSGNGYAYDSANPRIETYITATAAADTAWNATLRTGIAVMTTPVAAVPIDLSAVVDADGNVVNPELDFAGVLYIGNARTRVRYIAMLDLGAGLGVRVWLHPDDTVTPAADDAVIVAPSLFKLTTDFVLPALARKGTWVYKFLPSATFTEAAYDRIFTHHMEGGTELPPGMTIEVDRDAAIFVYTGMKVASMTVNFETSTWVTSDFTLSGQREYAMAELVEDAVPGDTTIVIRMAEHFPQPLSNLDLYKNIDQDFATITIGSETEIRYTNITDNGDGTYTLAGIDPVNFAISRLHLKGENVDLRTSTKRADVEVVVITVQGTVAIGEDFGTTITSLDSSGVISIVASYTTVAATVADAVTGLGADLLAQAAGNYSVDVDTGAGTITLTGLRGFNFATVVSSTTSVAATISDSISYMSGIHVGENTPLTMFEASFYIDGGIEEVLSGSITVDNQLNTDKFGASSRYRLQLIEQRRMTEGNINVEFDDGHNYIKFIKGSFFYFEVRCVSDAEDDCGEVLDITGIPNQMYFILPSARFGGTTPNIEGEDYITHDLPIMARFDNCYNTPDIVVIAVNRMEHDVIAEDAP